jgi:hypothetical protein
MIKEAKRDSAPGIVILVAMILVIAAGIGVIFLAARFDSSEQNTQPVVNTGSLYR